MSESCEVIPSEVVFVNDSLLHLYSSEVNFTTPQIKYLIDGHVVLLKASSDTCLPGSLQPDSEKSWPVYEIRFPSLYPEAEHLGICCMSLLWTLRIWKSGWTCVLLHRLGWRDMMYLLGVILPTTYLYLLVWLPLHQQQFPMDSNIICCLQYLDWITSIWIASCWFQMQVQSKDSCK